MSKKKKLLKNRKNQIYKFDYEKIPPPNAPTREEKLIEMREEKVKVHTVSGIKEQTKKKIPKEVEHSNSGREEVCRATTESLKSNLTSRI
jgi:hypothetical protein